MQRSALVFAIVLSVGMLSALTCIAQDYAPVPMPNSHHRQLYSQNTDFEYGIYVYMPPSYANEPDRTYPVVYMLDGNTDFYFGGEIQRSLLWSGQIQEFILVAIAYEGRNMRSRDFTPPPVGVDDESRYGAENFFTFITEELRPVIARDYRTDPECQCLWGHSRGGQFTLWTMFTHTDAFDRYIASSPVLDNMWRFEAAYAAAHDDLPVKCFTSVGKREGIELFERLISILESRDYPSLKLKHHIIAEGTHGAVAPQSYSEGVRFVLDRAIEMPPETLAAYAGQYVNDNGNTITMQFAGDHLIAINSGIRGATDLFPASKTVFFAKGWPAEFTFELDASGAVTAFSQGRGGRYTKTE